MRSQSNATSQRNTTVLNVHCLLWNIFNLLLENNIWVLTKRTQLKEHRTFLQLDIAFVYIKDYTTLKKRNIITHTHTYIHIYIHAYFSIYTLVLADIQLLFLCWVPKHHEVPGSLEFNEIVSPISSTIFKLNFS